MSPPRQLSTEVTLVKMSPRSKSDPFTTPKLFLNFKRIKRGMLRTHPFKDLVHVLTQVNGVAHAQHTNPVSPLQYVQQSTFQVLQMHIKKSLIQIQCIAVLRAQHESTFKLSFRRLANSSIFITVIFYKLKHSTFL